MTTRYAAMWSGGKDSALAVWRARRAGLEVACLLNFFDAESGRVRFHATRAELVAAQARAAGIPLRQRATSWGDFEPAFRETLEELRGEGFAGVIFGDIHLSDVRAWYEERVRAAGLEHVEPLWADEPGELLAQFVASGGRAVITCCEDGRLDESWLGRVIDERFLEDVARLDIDPCGENGEYHSFAFAGPLFATPIAWVAGERLRDGRFLQLDLLEPREVVARVVADVIAARADLAEGTRLALPKAWGALAARGVLAYRRAVGRAPEESERRALWEALWRAAHEVARTDDVALAKSAPVRIVSLVPAGTEIAAALGLADRLVGVTHDCDYPPQVRYLPKVTRSTIPADATSREIDHLVRSSAARGESTFHLDGDALRTLRPEVILGQTICRVCAVTLEQIPAALPIAPVVVPLEAESLEGVFADIARAAAALGAAERGAELVRALQARLAAVTSRVAGREPPRVACLEWLDPLFNGGHWVPEQVAIAGGVDVLGRPGARSRVVDWDEVRAADPDVVVVMPCGWDAQRALAEVDLLKRLPGWGELRAARAGRVYAVDGSSYFSRPGPRLVDGVEILAALLHPERFPAPQSSQALTAVAPGARP